MNTRPLLIFEGDCGFCNRCARFISRRLPTSAELKPWQRVNLDAYGVSEARARYEIVWVAADGRLDGGAQAVARLLLDCGKGWAALGALLRVPPIRWLAHGCYRTMARMRTRLPGGGPACGMRPPKH
ncbi:MAG: thiol-disulfide oxidoreductase DCC family protein [Sporichthyaceae bacterium]